MKFNEILIYFFKLNNKSSSLVKACRLSVSSITLNSSFDFIEPVTDLCVVETIFKCSASFHAAQDAVNCEISKVWIFVASHELCLLLL